MIYLFALVIVLAIILGGSYYAYRTAFYYPKQDPDKKPVVSGTEYDPYREEMRRIYRALKERPFETVTTVSFDGLTLSGRYYHVKDGAPLDIGFHGYKSTGERDFSGGSELSFEMEHNLLLVDQRAHGESGSRTITFGISERRDVLSWVEFALERFGKDAEILLYGVSMGGATVLMASELPLPENVKGIIADCPYSSPKDIICSVAKGMGFHPKLTWPFVKLGAKLYGGFDISETTAAKAVKNATVPILIIHGEGDKFVPCEMSDLVNESPALITRHTIPGAAHGISYLVDRARYREVVMDFMKKVL